MSRLSLASFEDQPLTASDAERLLTKAREARTAFRHVPTDALLDCLERAGGLWVEGSPLYQEAMRVLPDELSFSREMIAYSLKMIPALCHRPALERRLEQELGNTRAMDGFVSRAGFDGRLTAVPLGVLLHVTAGNIFLGAIDSLLMGFLTRNISLIKTSRRNQTFPRLFARSLREADRDHILSDAFAIIHWRGGDASVESLFKTRVDAIIAWGGEAMLASYREGLGPNVRLLDHGPKISFQVLQAEALRTASITAIAERMAEEISLWDQAACASPQNAFIQDGVEISPLLDALSLALQRYPLPRGRLDDDEAVEILKEKARAELTTLTEGGDYRTGAGYLIHVEPARGMRPSPLNRTLIIKRFRDTQDLIEQVRPYAPVLQSCSYLASSAARDDLLRELAALGVQRFAPLGTLLRGMSGAPHDGRYALAELVRLVPDENHANLIDFINEAIDEVPFYHALYEGKHLTSLAECRPVTGAMFAEHPLTRSEHLLRRVTDGGPRDGYFFSSGGTSGQPKYSFFTHAEFERTAEMLAHGLKSQGLRPGTRCANLFVAGSLWSSFLAVDRALERCGVTQLPIGGLADHESTLRWLDEFQAQAVFGLPSMLVSLAQESRRLGISLRVPIVCYAGEHLNMLARRVLQDIWKTEHFFSAGYASVDAGPIGYQCAHCRPGEHHLFADAIHMEIINHEAVVTSLARHAMPIIHYRTGDHVEWTPATAPCPCGQTSPRFQLLGRIDGQINIWSSRLLLADLEHALLSVGMKAPIYQWRVHETMRDGDHYEILTLIVESSRDANIPSREALAEAIHHACKDVALAYAPAFLHPRVAIEILGEGQIPRVPRTGKVRPLVDERWQPPFS